MGKINNFGEYIFFEIYEIFVIYCSYGMCYVYGKVEILQKIFQILFVPSERQLATLKRPNGNES